MKDNPISKYVKSLTMDNFVEIVTDLEKSNQYIEKLTTYIDQAEDKKLELYRMKSETDDPISIKTFNENITECNKIIKKIEADISFIKSSSMLATFYKRARKIVGKELLKKIDREVNSELYINNLSVGDNMQCVVSCGDNMIGEICVCGGIDKFNNLVSIKGKDGYHNVMCFRPPTKKV